jgi:hypothetical protein
MVTTKADEVRGWGLARRHELRVAALASIARGVQMAGPLLMLLHTNVGSLPNSCGLSSKAKTLPDEALSSMACT